MGNPEQEQPEKFDFSRHEQVAVVEYMHEMGFYSELAASSKRIAEKALKRRLIKIHSIEARAKRTQLALVARLQNRPRMTQINLCIRSH